MKDIEKLLTNNKQWAQDRIREDADFFNRLSKVQNPKFLWIGCSDSRVPANEITNTLPGEIYVHRNIANMVVHTDLNLLSVLQYAVERLAVEHIIVCGHYGCGGIEAAMGKEDLGLINKWLRNIKDVYKMHLEELSAIADRTQMLRRLTELNVIEQVQDLAETSIVQRSWKKRKLPQLHGWVYGIENGLIKNLCSVNGTADMDPLYIFNFDE